MSDLITFEVARARIKAAADERPGHTTGDDDSECRYLEDDGTPSCLVGAALADILVEAGLTPADDVNEQSVDALIDKGLISATEKAARFMEIAQSTQDGGGTWAQALERAEELVQNEDLNDTEAVEPLTF